MKMQYGLSVEVPTVAIVQIVAIWFKAQCNLTGKYRRFGGLCTRVGGRK
jgi:hypothetical protein